MDRRFELARALHAAAHTNEVLSKQIAELRKELREMTVERDDWRDRAHRNREECREVEASAALAAREAAAEIERLRAAAFPHERPPLRLVGLDAAEERFALIELDEVGSKP